MGNGKADAEIAKVIARHAQIQADRQTSPEAAPEWRWQRGGWGSQPLPSSLKAAPADKAGDEPEKS